MTWDVAKNFIDKLLSNQIPTLTTDKVFTIIVEFIGGEPLMEIDLIE
jgi:sulfatase maturation enzyme AslB (radical SAM superfamily)